VSDAVKSLATVVALAEERQKFGFMLSPARKFTETDEMTLKRILSERQYVVALLDEFFKKRFEGLVNPFKDTVEYEYKRTFHGAMEHVFAAAGVNLKKD
jgi:hypothetical protein